MTKALIIAEKPSVARDIAKALGGFRQESEWLESPTAVISSARGHLVEIYVPEAETAGRNLSILPIIPERFQLRPIDKAKSQFELLKHLMGRADVSLVINACDAGREGELIFRLIYEKAGCNKPTKRMWLQSMTADAIKDAYKDMKPGTDFDALADAAKCRSEADWLVGINSSRGVTRLNERLYGRSEMMSTGRVQTPTLSILCQREDEIETFVPDDYWEVHGTFEAAAGTYVGKWFDPTAVPAAAARGGDEAQEEGKGASSGYRINDKARAEAILKKCKGVNPSSVKDQSKPSLVIAPRLFDLTTLQREANKLFKFSAKKTLDIAQALYEKHKATSYPRTDATALPEDYIGKAKQVLADLKARKDFAPHADRVLTNSWVKPDKRIFDNSKITDHFAIIPTGTIPATMTDDESKVYALIVSRFIAAFHPPAEYSLTTRITVVAGESFKTTGRVLVKQGWLEVYGKQASDSKTPALCVVDPAEQVKTKSMSLKTLATKPPTRYTEATLLSAMEGAGKLVDDEDLREAMKERGLGTPATRAAIIEGLLQDKKANGEPKEPYVVREGKEQHLVPTKKGRDLVSFMKANGIEALTSPRMTGEWEHKLSLMEKGSYSRADFMGEIAQMTRSIIDVIRGKAGKEETISPLQVSQPCPNCGAALHAQGEVVDCKARCGFRLWRTIAGRTLNQEEVSSLLTNFKTDSLAGFVSRANKRFAAALTMDKKGKVSFVFEDNAGGDGSAPTATLAAACPRCKGRVSLAKGSTLQYACEKGDFSIWRRISGRNFTEDELVRLLNEGQLPQMAGFVSARTGRPFEAGLKLAEDKSRFDFVFAPR